MVESPEASAIAEAILRYLGMHPDAADSVDGIADWWMRTMRVETNVEAVEEALRKLHRDGLVARATLPDGRVIYRARSAPGD